MHLFCKRSFWVKRMTSTTRACRVWFGFSCTDMHALGHTHVCTCLVQGGCVRTWHVSTRDDSGCVCVCVCVCVWRGVCDDLGRLGRACTSTFIINKKTVIYTGHAPDTRPTYPNTAPPLYLYIHHSLTLTLSFTPTLSPLSSSPPSLHLLAPPTSPISLLSFALFPLSTPLFLPSPLSLPLAAPLSLPRSLPPAPLPSFLPSSPSAILTPRPPSPPASLPSLLFPSPSPSLPALLPPSSLPLSHPPTLPLPTLFPVLPLPPSLSSPASLSLSLSLSPLSPASLPLLPALPPSPLLHSVSLPHLPCPPAPLPPSLPPCIP